jgi:hypothetical protein
VRGDSLRDLYAKTLALVGLGLLAGVGALVDYWPVGVGTPHVAVLGPTLPERLTARPAEDVRVLVSLRQPEATPVRAIPALAADLGAPAAYGEPIVLSAPVVPAVETPPVAEPIPPVVEVVPVPVPAEPEAPEPDFDPSLVYGAGAAEDDSGLLAGAVGVMKSTGSTIARGGAITGASIVGAFRAVSGAFKNAGRARWRA